MPELVGDRPLSPHSYWNASVLLSIAAAKSLGWIRMESSDLGRVEEGSRDGAHSMSPMHVAVIWISCNLTAENIILGMLGPLQYDLTFFDSALCGISGAIIGSTAVAYVATFGPKSGHRTMIISRYVMGWFPAKFTALLNFVVLMGYLIIDAVAAGQILAAVSGPKNISIVVGIIISITIAAIVSVVGIRPFHAFERYAWLPQVMAICLLLGVTVPNLDFKEVSAKSSGDGETSLGHRLSFFGLCLAGSITYAPCAADVFVYLPVTTRFDMVFLNTMLGLTISFAITFLAGIVLGSGAIMNQAWKRAYEESPGMLIAESLSPLGGLGTACGTLLALGIVANMIMPSYSISFSLQMMGPWMDRIPRPVCTLLGAIICAICADWGRANLATIMINFVSLMGYWVAIWIAIFLEEDLIFRRYLRLGFDWDVWNDRKRSPVGIASTAAFSIGWVGVILCMAQTWFDGPVAAMIGADGADIASMVGFGMTATLFPPFRYLELLSLKR
ncbi:purine-cytosine permease FCY21 [Aureobasidium pullulans]|uniref:Purine-cytosine permease FCY21 n=1 Tax=Aureobasidium pullulans TaxID=5580 RepID=A0A4T0BHQ2_AURPU|nr:purine-cytosine permease FCY21 [Aureobasidium pullulans]